VVRFAATNPTATLSFVKSADQDSIAWVEELKFKQLPNRMAMIDLGLKAISSGKHAAVPKNVRLRGELPVTCKLIGADRLVREDVMLKTSECVNAVTALSARSFVSAYHE
jgi:hypothetical protein